MPVNVSSVKPESFEEKQDKVLKCDKIPDSVSSKLAPEQFKTKFSHSCPECGKSYMHYSSLHRHRKNTHKNNEGQIKCMEKGCAFTCFFVHQIRHHLSSVHEMTIEKEMLTFESYKGNQAI